jgi:hypothetical protein
VRPARMQGQDFSRDCDIVSGNAILNDWASYSAA